MSTADDAISGYCAAMEIPAVVLLGVVLIVFIVGGLVFAFLADRRRNERVAHDPERFRDTDHPFHEDGNV